METIDNIPISKIQRASKLLQTGAKVGVNYIKYYGDKMVNSEADAKGRLDKNNADDIYNSLKNLKGSALKVAQMLSMDKNILPEAYTEKFSLSQFSVPPLSPALVQKTFLRYFGKTPTQVFDTFSATSVNAASIGQVHKATKDGKTLAVKIQYPGVSDSISTDLAMVKPIAMKMFNIKGKDAEKYFQEVEQKLLEETNYELEVAQSIEISDACSHIPNLQFPTYYPAWSSQRTITMDWMTGDHLSEFALKNTDPTKADAVGQALWDFYMFQMHVLKKVHADPHPGNFLVSENNELIVLDFGCMKEVPIEFYTPYFELASVSSLADPAFFKAKLYELEILRENDTEKEIVFISNMFHELLTLFTEPLLEEEFDFSNADFFSQIATLGEKYAKNAELKKINANRGSKHFIYINRTFFGLYNLMHMVQAKQIKINNYMKYIVPAAVV